MSCSRLPKVSVVTPMYNAARYIEEAARSVLAQTFGDFEYIIVNDGSTDTSLDVARRMALEDGRIRVIDLGTNRGYASATNRCFEEACGEYIAVMDADDRSHPERLAKEVAYLDAHPNVGIVGTQYWRMDADGNVLRKTHSAHGDATIPLKLLFSVPMCNPTKMFRRGVLRDLQPDYYSTNLVASSEFDFFIRAARRWDIHVLPAYLHYYRIHPDSLSKSKIDTLMRETMQIAWEQINQKFPELQLHRTAIEAFIRVHRDTRTSLTEETLALFLEGLDRLSRACMEKCKSEQERNQLKAFVFELEVKTLLGRYMLFKFPRLLWKWVSCSHCNHLNWVPHFLIGSGA